MIRLCLWLTFCAWLAATPLAAFSHAADGTEMFEARTYVDPQGGQLRYRLLQPASYDPQQKYPLVLFLHGAGERGDDNQAQLVWGMREFSSEAVRGKFPCFVVAPQCPKDEQWVDVPWSADKHTMPEQPTAALRKSLELVGALQKEFSIDADRLYATGLSMGGFGVWDAIQRRPRMFAAAAPVCGGGDPAYAGRIAQVAVWAFHGDQDTVVKPQRSREMVEALKAAGGSPKYTEYQGVGHNSWSPTYQNPEFYTWLFAQRANDR